MDLQHFFRPGGKFSGHAGGMIRRVRFRFHLHAEFVLSSRYLHGVELVTLHTMKDNQALFVGPFQAVGIAQFSIHPNGKMRLRKRVLNFYFQGR